MAGSGPSSGSGPQGPGRAPGAVHGLGALRRSAVVERVRASLWFVPSIFVALACGAALGLSAIEVTESSPLRGLVFPGGPESARAILQAIAGSVITVTGVVFSLTVVTLQLASTQFSPRLLRTFLRDISNQVVLGTFLATFAYALLVLRAVRSGPTQDGGVVPALAVTAAYVLAAASVFALVYFVDHIARSIRIDSLMREVNEDTAEVIDDLAPATRERGSQPRAQQPQALPEAPPDAAVVRAHRSGFVQAIDDERLLRAAAAGLTVLIEPRVGDRVVEGGPLARVWCDDGGPGRTAGVSPDIGASVRIGFERTLQQDIAFGFRQLVDIAVKALSPGVNDPTTAIHAIGHLTALLVRVADHGLGPRVLTGAAGAGRVVVPALDLSGYLDLSCGQIRRYGAGEPAVMAELLTMLRDVARREVAAIHRQAIARQADMVVAAAERETPEPRDLELINALADEVHGLVVEKGQTSPPTPTAGGSP